MPYINKVNVAGTTYDIKGSIDAAGGISTPIYISSAGTPTVSTGLNTSTMVTVGERLVGNTGTVSTGNITTTVPTAAGTNNQIMFVIVD